MSQDKQFRSLTPPATELSDHKLIIYWEKKRTLMYNVNPITDERNVRVIF